ncbi:MAG: hypothetical protein H6645_08685 [Caldilineaceae bacterium]|nr:hypothetical protein [Caldilineaceae bacterium]MCB9157178.1 hypothetical protein [Caldilineaceae bacterium]
MATEVNLVLPDNLYLRAQQLAEAQKQSLQTVLLDELAKAILSESGASTIASVERVENVECEKRAFRALYERLWAQYPNHHVAIYNGELVDHDQDGIALSRRVYAQYPDEFVLIKKVEPQPERTLRFRSPRFVKEKASAN